LPNFCRQRSEYPQNYDLVLQEFIVTQANARKDAYSLDCALEMLYVIVQGIRTSTSTDFVISVKLNAADYSPTDITEDSLLTEGEQRALEHLLALTTWRLIDIVEISGGDYDQPGIFLCKLPSYGFQSIILLL